MMRTAMQGAGLPANRSMDAAMQAYELRPSIEADNDAIAEVWHTSASLPGVGPPVIPSLAELRERVDREFATGWRVTLAVSDSGLLGFVAIKVHQAVLDQLFVRPASLGLGIGRALLQDAMAAMPNGFTLFTRSTNARARRFYESAGLVFLRAQAHPRTGDPVIYYGWNGR